MEPPKTRLLWVLASAGALLVSRPAGGQSVGAAPPEWQPFRQAAEADESLAELPPSIVPAQPEMACPTTTLVEEAIVFPQPVFAAPVCETPCYAGGLSYVDSAGAPPTSPEFWQWRVLPDGVIWQSYWAGLHEPRISGVPFQNQNGVNLLDVALGGRGSLLRYGTDGPGRPLGAELQIEGAAFPRLNLDENWDLEAVDFRFGLPLIYGRETWETKFSYYHLSSHMGDELAIREAALGDRINFSRDCLVLALAYHPLPAWRWYAEAAWAFHYDESQPWEFQFGVDVAEPGPTGFWGTPFMAVNGHIREEVDYGGNVVAQLGWLWRGNSTRTLRTGFHYFNGKSNQFEFFDQFEEQIGGGLWYEF
jgi:hypothetical protein